MEKCPECGEAKERWEFRCAQCCMRSDASDDWPILLVGPSLRYRLVAFLTGLAGAFIVATTVYFGASPAAQLLASLFSGALLTILALALLLIEVVVMVGCVTAAYDAYGDFRNRAIFEVSKTKITLSNVINEYDSMVDEISGGTPTNTRFVDYQVELDRVRRTLVKQGWLARRLSYGDIEIYADPGDKLTVRIPGVHNPHAFRKRLELLLKSRASLLLEQGALSKSQTP
jgi:hypothetical protein